MQANSLKVQEHSNDATRILKSMRRLLREKTMEFVEMELSGFLAIEVETARKELIREFPHLTINLVMNLEPDLPPVRLQPYEFGQAVQDVLNNAGYALSEKNRKGGSTTPEIRLSARVAEGHAVVQIRDNGTGIPVQDIPKLCSPYFTTKPPGKGSGLGLFLAKSTMEAHHGKFLINSQAGEFAEVTMTIPLLAI
jgi:signal transduction histidine kinase